MTTHAQFTTSYFIANSRKRAEEAGSGTLSSKVRWGNFGNGVTSEILIFVQHQSARQRDIMFYLG